MNIQCNSVTVTSNSLSDKRLVAHCEEVRADLVLQEVIDLKGVEFVLQAIGTIEVIEYLKLRGYVVSIDAMFNFKAA